MRKRLLGAAVVFILVGAACSGDGTTTTTTTTMPPSTVVVAATASTTTTVYPTSTPPITAPPGSQTALPLVVAGPGGVYEVDAVGHSRLLIAAAVEFAIDDTMGGLLFQISRGRPAWDGTAARDTTVWWVPAGSADARTLLVPTPGANHALSLHDAYFDGGLHVVYSRHEGTMSPDDGPDGFVDRLRVYDVEQQVATDLLEQGAFEQGLNHVSCSDGVIALTLFDQVSSECMFLDHEGTEIAIPANVEDPLCEEGCRRACVLAWGGHLLMYLQDYYQPDDLERKLHGLVVFVDSETGAELQRITLPAANWRPESLDAVGTRVVVSFSRDVPALIFDLADIDAGHGELPIAGIARFARAPLDIPGALPLATAVPDHYRFGEVGLFAVIDGKETPITTDPVEAAWSDYHGGVLYRFDWTVDRPGTFWQAAGATNSVVLAPSYDFFFAGDYGDSPTLFYPAFERGCDTGRLVGGNLLDGTERTFMCDVAGQDGGWSISSYGGDKFVGVQWVAVGGTGTGRTFGFWSDHGVPIEVANNPFAESCEPCELTGRLSPDGELLALSHRPDALWPTSPYFTEEGDTDGWWAGSRHVPTTVSVVHLASGERRWSVEVPAENMLADFDGRYAVVTSLQWRSDRPIESTIYDTFGEHSPITVPGHVSLWK